VISSVVILVQVTSKVKGLAIKVLADLPQS